MSSEPQVSEAVGDQINRLYRGEIFTERAQRWARERMQWFLDHAQGDRALDIGCSQGIASILLGREGYRCLGVDIAEPEIAYAREELAKEDDGTRERVRFEVMDARDLPEGEYDTIIIGEVLEHDPDPSELIEKASRSLAPDGRVLITVPYGYQPASGHVRSFYFENLYDLVSKHLVLNELILLNRNLACVASHREDGSAFRFDRSCVSMVEALYGELGQELYEVKDRLNERAEVLTKTKEQVVRLKESLSGARAESRKVVREAAALREALLRERRSLPARLSRRLRRMTPWRSSPRGSG